MKKPKKTKKVKPEPTVMATVLIETDDDVFEFQSVVRWLCYSKTTPTRKDANSLPDEYFCKCASCGAKRSKKDYLDFLKPRGLVSDLRGHGTMILELKVL